MDHMSPEEVSKMLAWTIRALLIPVCVVLTFWAFSTIALSVTGGPSGAGPNAPVVVPSPERPCVATNVARPEQPCVAPDSAS